MNKFVFRYWDIDNPTVNGRAYLDIWDELGNFVSQKLIPKGLEDAYFELVEAHVKAFPEAYKSEEPKPLTFKVNGEEIAKGMGKLEIEYD